MFRSQYLTVMWNYEGCRRARIAEGSWSDEQSISRWRLGSRRRMTLPDEAVEEKP
jgi:hypothetical protein